jgi:putative transcriptional regulator
MPDLEISNGIRQLRTAHSHMTQLDLAKQIGVTRQTVNAIELGKYCASLEVAFRIAAIFAVPLESVFSFHK